MPEQVQDDNVDITMPDDEKVGHRILFIVSSCICGPPRDILRIEAFCDAMKRDGLSDG